MLGTAFALRTLLLHIPADEKGVDAPLETLPYQLGEWRGQEGQVLGVREKEILQLDRHIQRIYTNQQNEHAAIYVGYWRKQSGEYQAAKHSPVICLPANGWKVFNPEAMQIPVTLNGQETALTIKRLYGSFQGKGFIFYYWFFSGEKIYLHEWQALIQIALERFFHHRSDGGIVEISIPIELANGSEISPDHADAMAKDYIAQLYPPLHQLITAAAPEAAPR